MRFTVLAFSLACLAGPAGAQPPEREDETVTGRASFYADKFHGRRTASGERLNQAELTAAHPDLPMGSLVEITNLENGKSVVLRVNDRGPFTPGRVLDVTREAAERLDMVRRGVVRVGVKVLRRGHASSPAAFRAASEPPPAADTPPDA